MFLQKQIEREVKAALGEPARAAMAGRTTFGEQFCRRLALIEILRDGCRSAQRDYQGNNKQTAGAFIGDISFPVPEGRAAAALGRGGRWRRANRCPGVRKMVCASPSLRSNRGIKHAPQMGGAQRYRSLKAAR